MTPRHPPMHSNVRTRLSMSLISYMHPGQNVYWMTKRVCIATTRIAFKKYLWQTFHPITFSSARRFIPGDSALTCLRLHLLFIPHSLAVAFGSPPPRRPNSAFPLCSNVPNQNRRLGTQALVISIPAVDVVHPGRCGDSRSFGRVRNCLPEWVGEGAVDRDFGFADFLARGRRRGGGWVGWRESDGMGMGRDGCGISWVIDHVGVAMG